VLVPLVVLPDGRIVSGHRRWGAARAEGLVAVPTKPYAGDPADEWEIKAAILEHNRQREKTPDQRLREVTAMLEIEQERGRRKKAAAGASAAPGRPAEKDGAQNAPSFSANGRAPKSSAIVGDLVGMSARQVEMAAAVVKTIDDMVTDGDYKGAEDVRQTLNKAGIGPAYKEVRKARGQSAGPIRAPGTSTREREKRNAIPHDPVRAGEVIRNNFSREFALALIGELQRLLSEPW
jgi:ParB-like chromosome segregation protein Spo0J